jgi:hypothetical protein
MRPIEVFYHLLIPPDARAVMWTWWVDQQLGLIKQSKLHNVAKVNLAITMPYDWIETFGIFITANTNVSHQINFGEKVKEYINIRYPFVNIINIRHTSEPNIYEGQTLALIHERCKEVDIDVCYIHSKGIINTNPATANWREVLNHYIITEWTQCVRALETADVVGVKDLRTFDLMTSGNFWWSKSSYINKLAGPIQSNVYLPNDPGMHPDTPSYRYAFERWIMMASPVVNYIVDTKTDHYGTYCFLENLTKHQ